jgi:hypothetical protein
MHAAWRGKQHSPASSATEPSVHTRASTGPSTGEPSLASAPASAGPQLPPLQVRPAQQSVVYVQPSPEVWQQVPDAGSHEPTLGLP